MGNAAMYKMFGGRLDRSCSNPLTCMNSGMIFSLYLNAYRNIQSSVSIILRIAAEKIVLFY